MPYNRALMLAPPSPPLLLFTPPRLISDDPFRELRSPRQSACITLKTYVVTIGLGEDEIARVGP